MARHRQSDEKKHREKRGHGRSGIGAVWTGTISFGLVNVPVQLVPATRSTRVPLHLLGPEGHQLRREYVCPEEHEPLDREEIVRGFPLPSGEIVPFADEEIEALHPERSRNLELERFVDRSELSPVYFDRGYYLVPDEGGSHAYRLLAKAMTRAGRAGIGTFVLRGKEVLVAILAEGGILRAETLRFSDEVRSLDQMGIELEGEPDKALVGRLQKALKALKTDALPRDLLEDTYQRRLQELIAQKAEAGEDLVAEEEGAEEALRGRPAEEDEEELPPPIDLMKVLKQSLAEEQVPKQSLSEAAEEEAEARPARHRSSRA